MITVTTFYFLLLLPGMSGPLVHEEKTTTLEECIGMVANAELRARMAGKTGKYQAGCLIEIPKIEEH